MQLLYKIVRDSRLEIFVKQICDLPCWDGANFAKKSCQIWQKPKVSILMSLPRTDMVRLSAGVMSTQIRFVSRLVEG